jgi:hypothetical protein
MPPSLSQSRPEFEKVSEGNQSSNEVEMLWLTSARSVDAFFWAEGRDFYSTGINEIT